jgi:hypothetical protein
LKITWRIFATHNPAILLKLPFPLASFRRNFHAISFLNISQSLEIKMIHVLRVSAALGILLAIEIGEELVCSSDFWGGGGFSPHPKGFSGVGIHALSCPSKKMAQNESNNRKEIL